MAKPSIPVARSKSDDGSGVETEATSPVPPLSTLRIVHPVSPQVPSKRVNPIVPPVLVKVLRKDRSNTGEVVKSDDEGFGKTTISVADGPRPRFTPRYVAPPNEIPNVVKISTELTVFVFAS
jgi:hypothetical protein